jgi:hypothetical protein
MSLETMTKLASTTVGVGGVASVTFSNIPQGYTDLVVKGSFRVTVAGPVDGIKISFNGSTELFTNRSVLGNGTSAFSESTTSARWVGLGSATGATASTFSNFEVYIPNYAGSTYKSFSAEAVSENNATAGYNYMFAGLWSNPAAINQITLTPDTASAINQHSTFTLYGIKNAAQTAGNSIKATGGNIVFDGTYVYHVFNATGSFTPTQSILADALVVAGGGGSSIVASGGGGAGGLLGYTNQSLNPTSYAVTIGAGGAGVNNRNAVGAQGSSSQFGALTASEGGGGGAGYPDSGTKTGGNGGSGGGGSGTSGNVGGTATPAGQGNNGGGGDPTGGVGTGGGGGGAGAAGGNGSLGFSGAGGNGSTAYSSWGVATGQGQNVSGTYYFAGGGSGGAYSTSVARDAGYGGGGKGSAGTGATPGANGTANTGGGAGGTGGITSATGATGGSGLVIIRYKG